MLERCPTLRILATSRERLGLPGELVCPVQLLALKFGDAATVNAWAPSPAGAVVVNVQFDFAVADVWRGSVAAPVTATHWVSLDVTTVRVGAPPCLA